MRQRYYDSSLGRWLSADPIGFKGGLNLYAYVGQNPVGRVDPSGLKKITFGPWEFEVHLGDADPLPSNPHAHINKAPNPNSSWADPRTRTKVDLISGEIKQGANVVGNLSNIEGAEEAFLKAMGSGCAVKRISAGEAQYWKILSGIGGKAIRVGGWAILIPAMMADSRRVASAAPCDRAKVAGEVGVGWLSAWAIGALAARYLHPGVLAGVGYAQMGAWYTDAVNNSPDRQMYYDHFLNQ